MKKIIFILIATIFLFQKSFSENDNIYDNIDIFGELLEKINKEYVDDVDPSKSMDAAINGLLQSLDPYSAYMTPESFKSMQTETSGEFGGLGIEVGMEAGVVKVISPIDDTPASKAGLKAGDYIVKIEKTQVQGKTLTEAVELMRVPVGSSLEITVRRKGKKKALIFNITREIIKVQSVKSKILNDSVGYIRLTSFNENSSQQIKKTVLKFNKNKNLNSFILDLRNNPGGLLSQAIKISDFFLENGEIVSTKSRRTSENRRWFAKKGDLIDGKSMIVLINYGSASASEIVAGALKDHSRAIVIGTRSFGKGSVQSIIPLAGNGAMRLTTARYFTPSGISIQAKGIEPDIIVEAGVTDLKKAKNDNRREENLRGALDKKKNSKKTEIDTDSDKPLTPLEKLLQDNQISRAVDMIRGISLFNKNELSQKTFSAKN